MVELDKRQNICYSSSMRKKTSIVWQIPAAKLAELVRQSTSIGQVLNHFGLVNKGRNHHTLKQRLIDENIDFSHIPMGVGSNKGRVFIRDKVSLSEVLIKDSTYSRGNLKRRLLEENILKEICNECGIIPIWNNKKLVLVLDHINGIYNDNRLDNLQLLCPNCNSQTDTFCGKTRFKKQFHCIDCFGIRCRESKSKLCIKCSNKSLRKVDRPSKDILLQDINAIGYVKTGKKYGVSDNAVRKWIK